MNDIKNADKFVEQWLQEDDATTFLSRLERLRFLLNEYGEERHQLFHGGLIPYYAFEEARRCFLNGQFIATILLSQIVIEQNLAGIFKASGRDDLDRSGFNSIIREALLSGIVNQEEFELFDRLRILRNSYGHYRGINEKTGFPKRFIELETGPEALLEEDARKAISTMFGLLKRYPFGFPDRETDVY